MTASPSRILKTFEVEKWMDDYEMTAKYNIAETCVSSLSLDELQALSDPKTGAILPPSTKLNYGPIRGSDKLRDNLSQLYSAKTASSLSQENILITPGAITANFLVFYALVGRGDHVICHWPTYQQLYAVPASLGAEVSLWKAQEEKDWQLDIEELKKLIKPNTKLIVINNPNNPTGAVIGRSIMEQLIEIAEKKDITIFSDEVYRPLFHGITPLDKEFPPSILSMGYRKTIATGSMSKAWSLAGIRVGWIASRCEGIVEQCAHTRHYTTISVSQIDDHIASFALDSTCVHSLLSRNLQLAKTNLALLEKFIEKHRWACDWVKPQAGTTAFVKFSREGNGVDDVALCKLLFEKKGVLFCPGSLCFGDGCNFAGYVRIGYVTDTTVLEQGLEELKDFMRVDFKTVTLAN